VASKSILQGSITQSPSPTSLSSPQPGTTPSPTEFIPIIVIQVAQVDVRSGPDPIFLLLIQVKSGLSLRAVGRNAENTHLLILLPDNRQGWIPVEAAAFDFDLALLPIAMVPPTPTFTPTPTPQPTPNVPPEKPKPTKDTEPYGQGILAPPQITGVAPTSPGSPNRRALGVVSVILLSLLALSQRGWTLDLLRPGKPVITRLAQALSALL
jgi:hypothetical protein